MTPQTLKVSTNQQFDTFVLDVDLELTLGQGIIGVYGRTGAGKSSLLKAIAGLGGGSDTELWLDGRPVDKKADLNPCVYQSQHPSLLPNLSVIANLKSVQKHTSWRGQNGLTFDSVVALCGIDELLPMSVSSLSGGQQQMVSFARTLLSGKSVVLLDEPFSALDWQVRRRKQQLLKQLNRDYGINFVLVSHQLDELAWVSDRIVELKAGQVALNESVETAVAKLQGGDEAVKFSRLRLYFDKALPEHNFIRWRLSQAVDAATILTHSIEQAAEQVALLEANKVVLVNSAQPANNSSAVNQVLTTVSNIEVIAGRVLLALEVDGQSLLAEISAYSLERMNLEIGQTVIAQFKSI